MNGAATMYSQLETIVELQSALDELNQFQGRIDGIPDWMKELHDEHQAKTAEIDAVAERAEEARSQRREAEAQLADAQAKLEHFQGQIGRVTTQREYGALLKEIDTVKGLIAGFEKVALESIDLFDAAQKELDELRERFSELDERYGVELAKWEAEKPAVAETIADLDVRVTGLREAIELPHLRLFDRLYDRNGGQAMAPLMLIESPRSKNREWRCSSCNYRVRPQVVVEIRNQGAIIQCDCGRRILYLE